MKQGHMDLLEFSELKTYEIDRNFLKILNQLDSTNKTKDMSVIDAQRAYMTQVQYGRETYTLKKFGEIIGIASIIKDYRIPNWPNFSGHIEDVAIRKDLHGFGYGKILMTKLKEKLTEMGAYKAILSCSNYNIKFYKKCGFTHSCATMRIDL
jgi:GNAT superfamily N-acetyltransferase